MKISRATSVRTITSLAVLVFCLIIVPVGQENQSVQAMKTPKADRLFPTGRKM
ncbi:MAG: hypothetical protein OEM63_14110 [Gammaproteobacteria bacterium]|nr:hypothetical protein [Gammaproteobacteria bacterium]